MGERYALQTPGHEVTGRFSLAESEVTEKQFYELVEVYCVLLGPRLLLVRNQQGAGLPGLPAHLGWRFLAACGLAMAARS
jgi:hypothetical protein